MQFSFPLAELPWDIVEQVNNNTLAEQAKDNSEIIKTSSFERGDWKIYERILSDSGTSTPNPEKDYHKCEFKKVLPNKPLHKCEVCDTKFKYKGSLTKHITLDHQEKIIAHKEKSFTKCKYCARDFSNRNQLELHNHIQIHETMVPSYTCEICGFVYAGKGFLNKHIAKIHPEKKINLKEIKKYQCDFCQKSYEKIDDLKKHTQTSHHEEDIDVTDTMHDLEFAMAEFEDGKTTCKL